MAFFKNIPYELVLGWRYTRAGRATRRNGFISFISGVSMMGIGLGVAALIIVLSVMNGFQKEVRDRMLGGGLAHRGLCGQWHGRRRFAGLAGPAQGPPPGGGRCALHHQPGFAGPG